MSEPEPPFRPREKLIEKQKYFQSINKPTYLKGPYDKITSVAIPLALAATTVYMTVKSLSSSFTCPQSSNLLGALPIMFLMYSVALQARGIYNMAHGIGKKDML